MTMVQNPQTKTELVNRLRRVEGQVRGLQAMIAEERECRQVLQQMNAARSALQAAMLLFMEEYASECVLKIDPNNPRDRRDLVHEMIGMLNKAAA